MPSTKHRFVSAKAPAADSTLVRSLNWNEEHDLKTLAASVYLGQDASGGGDVKELPIEARPGDDYTIMTKDAIEAAIAAAIANLKPFETGDFSSSFRASKTGGWVLCNGQTLNIGNGQSNHDLFIMLWGFTTALGPWPVVPTRGASAEADWTAGKQVPVPDATGCVLGMVDASGTVNSLLTSYGIKVGAENLYLTVENMPAHTHSSVTLTGSNSASTGGPVQGGTGGVTGSTGGDPAAVPPYSNTRPFNITQPTMGVNFFIKL